MSTSQIEALNNPPLEKQEDNPNKPQDETRPDQEGNQESASNLTQSQPNKVEPVEAGHEDNTQNLNEPSVAEKPKIQEKHDEEKKPEEHAKHDNQELMQKTPETPKQDIPEGEQQAPAEHKKENQTQENNGPKPEILITETKSEKVESLKESRVEEQKPSPSIEVKTEQKSANLDVQDKKDQAPTLPTVNSLIISQAQRPGAHSPSAKESDNKKVQETLLSPKSNVNEKTKKNDNNEKEAGNPVQKKEDPPKENNHAEAKEEIKKDPVEQPVQKDKPQEQEVKENKKEEKPSEPHQVEEVDKAEEKALVQETHETHHKALENAEDAIMAFISPNKVQDNEGSSEINTQLAEAFKATPLVAKSEHNDVQDEKETKQESVKPDAEGQNSPKQEVKEKKEKNVSEPENHEKPKKKKKEKTPVQEAQQDNNNLTEAISAFISPAKLGSDTVSNEINTNLAEAFQGTSLVAKKKQAEINPDEMEGVTGFGEEDEEAKEKRSDHTTKSPKMKKQKSEKSPTGKAQPADKKQSKMKNEFEFETALETQSTAKDFKSQSPKKPAQLKVRVELAAAAIKKKNTMEEQLRVHKMQEMSRWKKQLEGKLEAITEQMVTLAQQSEERSSSLSPGAEGSAKKKLAKGEIAEKQKKAVDLAKRMQMERKEMERRKEKRREVRQAIVLKEIDLVHQRQLDSLELINGPGSARARFENDVSKLKDKTKQESIFAALEEKKYEIKVKRGFNKVTESDTNEISDGSPSLERADRKEGQRKIKMPKKQVYRSPVLNKVLLQDAEIKRIEFEQKERKRLLHGRQVGYGKEVRDSFFPYLHPLKQADSYMPLMNNLYSPTRVQNDLISPTKSKEQIRLPHIEKRESPAAKSSQKSLSNMDELFKPKRTQAKQHQKDKEEFEEFMRNDANYGDQVEPTEEEWESSKKGVNNSKSSVNVAPRNKSLPAAQRKKQTVAEIEVDDYGYESQQRKGGNQKVHVQKKEPEVEEEQNEWEQELEADQEMMKEKIAAMLGDIKKMETQIKRKEERMLKDMEKKMAAKAHV